ncbi:MAG TPA: endolytic transglycosylase MltG [Gemmatimonadales bacterium]|jgi:UPF0755 protein
MKRCLVAALCVGLAACQAPGPNAPKAHVYIPRGSSLKGVTDSLLNHGVIETGWTFRLYSQLRGLTRRVRPGLYAFPLGERWSVIVGALATGRTDDALFTVPEGLTVRQIADLAAGVLRLATDSVRSALRDSFLAAARDSTVRNEFGITVPKGVKEPLEGYLLPESYRVAYDETPRDLVKHMLRQFMAVWDTSADRKAAAMGMTRTQALTLASIVEGEARMPAERKIIAGVYYNRWRKHMLLQADPTVIYAVQLNNDKPIHRVLYRHLKVHSPYNTYLYPGLPPGPINNPGRASIYAALEPARHNLLYFVAAPDGHSMFSATASEHADSVAVARILRAQAEAVRDSITRDSIAAAHGRSVPTKSRAVRP